MGSTIWFWQRVERSYRKTSFAITIPNHFIILLPIHQVALQLQKEPLHRIQLPIIKILSKILPPPVLSLSLCSHKSATHASFALDKAYKLGNSWLHHCHPSKTSLSSHS